MILVLLASVLFSTPSQASSLNAPLLANTARAVEGAQSDVSFLHKNAGNCTRFADTIEQQLVAPVDQELADFQARLERYTNTAPRSCGSRADLDYIIGTVAQRLALATTPQSQLMGMTVDEAMTKALSSDSAHPDCRPEDPQDAKSTRELKAYFALKLKLMALKASAASLKAATECAKRE